MSKERIIALAKTVMQEKQPFEMLQAVAGIILHAPHDLQAEIFNILFDNMACAVGVDACLADLERKVLHHKNSRDNDNALATSWIIILFHYLSAKHRKKYFTTEQLHKLFKLNMLIHTLMEGAIETLLPEERKRLHAITICVLHCTISQINHLSVIIKVKRLSSLNDDLQIKFIGDVTQWLCHVQQRYYIGDRDHLLAPHETKQHFQLPLENCTCSFTQAWHAYDIASLFPLYVERHYVPTTTKITAAKGSVLIAAELQLEIPLATLRTSLRRCEFARLSQQELEWKKNANAMMSIIQIYRAMLHTKGKKPSAICQYDGILWGIMPQLNIKNMLPDIIERIILEFSQIKIFGMEQEILLLRAMLTRAQQKLHAVSNKAAVPRKKPAQTRQLKKTRGNPKPTLELKPKIKATSPPQPKAKPKAADKPKPSPVAEPKTAYKPIAAPKDKDAPHPDEIRCDNIEIIKKSLILFDCILLHTTKHRQSVDFIIDKSDARKMLGAFLARKELDFADTGIPRAVMVEKFIQSITEYYAKLFSLEINSVHYPDILSIRFETLSKVYKKLPRSKDLDDYITKSIIAAGAYSTLHPRKAVAKAAPKYEIRDSQLYELDIPDTLSTHSDTEPDEEEVTVEAGAKAITMERLPKSAISISFCDKALRITPMFLRCYQELMALFRPLLTEHPYLQINIKGGFVTQTLFTILRPHHYPMEQVPCDIDLEIMGASREEFFRLASEFKLQQYGLVPSPDVASLCQITGYPFSGSMKHLCIDISCNEKLEPPSPAEQDFIHSDIRCPLLPDTSVISFDFLSEKAKRYFSHGLKFIMASGISLQKTFKDDKARVLRAMHLISAHGFQLAEPKKSISLCVHRLFDFKNEAGDRDLFLRKVIQYSQHSPETAIHFWYLVKDFGFFAKLAGIHYDDSQIIPYAFYQQYISERIINPMHQDNKRFDFNELSMTCRTIWLEYCRNVPRYDQSCVLVPVYSPMLWHPAGTDDRGRSSHGQPSTCCSQFGHF
ncbi:MAG: hypothetical protein K0U29_01605 [Gammaproteobacteria bacterium]|nr:hypothetical protein [Gammaproteobacteria bacterium]